MACQIDKEKTKKRNIKLYCILGGVCYLLFVIGFFHYTVLKRQYPRLGVSELVNKSMTDIFTNPFNMLVTSSSITNLVLITILVAAVIALIIAQQNLKKHDNPDTVNGSAHLMTGNELKQYNLKFSAPLKKPENDGVNNMILSKDIRLAIDNKGTRRNCNVLIIGGSGAGKTRFFAAPNILQYNCNFVITDPSGEMLRDYGKALEDNGYAVKVFNLTDVYRSSRYNPFHYIKEEKDVFILVNTLISNTKGDNKGGDKFWEDSERLLLTALILYLWHVAPPEDQTFANVVKMINLAEVDENDASAESTLDTMFNDLENTDPENLAVQQYKSFKLAAGKTLKSILISVAVRLQTFKLSDIQYLTSTDDFELEKFSDTKQALFVILPTGDMTFNFLASLLYSQLFTSLYRYAETKAEYGWKLALDDITNISVEQADNKNKSKAAKQRCEELLKDIRSGVTTRYDKEKKLYRVYTKKGKKLIGWRGTKELTKSFLNDLQTTLKVEKCEARCPIHVRLILDEFANIGQIPEFDEKLSTMRKYEISCSIILQALSQLKNIYDKKWNTIVANCDTKLFLGCDDEDTIKWMTGMLGKRTTTVQNESYQAANKGGSTSYNKSSQELLTVDQITMMQDDECLVRIRGVRPYYGKKYELTKHPNYDYAQKVKGTFEIPESPDAVNRRSGPLRDRIEQEKEKIRQSAGDAEDGEIPPNAETGSTIPPLSEQMKPKPAAFNEQKAKNGARKEKASKAKEELQNFEEVNEQAQEMVAEAMLDSLGLSKDSTPERIKESAESFVMLMDVPSGNMEFGKTE